jgi:tetratricopeptide (TPR) repeat protein
MEDAMTTVLRSILLLLATLCHAAASDQATAVAPEVAGALRAVEAEGDPAKGLAALDAYKGPEHAYIDLARGQLLLRLPARDDAERERHRADAVAAFTGALKLDPRLRQARLGLAQVASDRGDWRTASAEIGAALDWSGATSPELLFAAQCAIRGEDWRAGTVIVQQGIARFPAEKAFRRMELALLVRGGRADEARQALLALLADAPQDADLWQELAWAEKELHRDGEAVAALEVALHLKPEDPTLRRHLAAAQLAHAMPQAALETVTPLMTEHAGTASTDVVELAARCASEAAEHRLGRAWIAQVPADRRSRGLRLLAAQLAVQAGEPEAAVPALRELVALGERDASVLVWAGHIAEQAGDPAAAEAFYVQAAGSDHPASASASLRLVVLYLQQDRVSDARAVLSAHLLKRPQDEQAKALQAQIGRRR